MRSYITKIEPESVYHEWLTFKGLTPDAKTIPAPRIGDECMRCGKQLYQLEDQGKWIYLGCEGCDLQMNLRIRYYDMDGDEI